MLICDLCERPAINTIYLTVSYLEPKDAGHEYHRCEEHQVVKMPVLIEGEPVDISKSKMSFEDFCDEHKPPMKAVLHFCFICNAPAKYKCEWYPDTTDGGTGYMQEWVCQTHYDSLQQTESLSLEIIEEVETTVLESNRDYPASPQTDTPNI